MMPVVIVKMLEGRTTEQKRRLVRAITDSVVEHAGTSAEQVDVVIEDYPRENWSKGGVLMSDK